MEGKEKISTEKTSRPKLFGSCRLNLSILMFFAFFLLFYVRLNFSMAIVCMTGTNVSETDPGYIEGEFGWTPVEVGILLSSFFYGYIATLMIGGWISHRFGEKIPLLVSYTSFAITCIILPVSTRVHWGFLLAIRVIQGFFSGFTFPVIYNVFTSWTTESEKATLMSISIAGIPFANVINYPLSSLLCYTGVDSGWPLIFYFTGSACLIWVICCWYVFSENPEDHPRISNEEKLYLQLYSFKNVHVQEEEKRQKIPYAAMIKSIHVHAIWIAMFSCSWVFYLIGLNLPIFINETFNLGIVQNGFLCGCPYVLVFLMTFSGKLFDYLLNKRNWNGTLLVKIFNTIGLIGPATALSLMGLTQTSIVDIILLSLAAALFQLTQTGGFFITFADVAGEFAGFLFGASNTLAQTAGLVNPLVIAWLVPEGDREDWQIAFYLGALICVLGAIFYLFFGTKERQPWADGQFGKNQSKTVVNFDDNQSIKSSIKEENIA